MPAAAPASLLAQRPRRRVCLGRLLQDIQVHHQLADRALQTRDLLLRERRIIEWAAAQGVLGAAQEALLPRLNLSDR